MKAHEVLALYRKQLAAMTRQGISSDDIRYLDMYKEYLRMVNEGHKKTYIIAFLSDEYRIGQRTLYRLIDKLSADIPI